MTVAVLFARQDSIYKMLPGCDVWDMDRDARRWPGGAPVVAHPPCRAWGRLRKLAKPRPDEKALAFFAVEQVMRYGGVLEHPAWSTFWDAAHLPKPGQAGVRGWTLPIVQSWWGHRAEKATWLYIVGCAPSDVPAMPLVLGDASHVVTQSRCRGGQRLRKGMQGWRPECTKPEREQTPRQLAEWLVDLAGRCA